MLCFRLGDCLDVSLLPPLFCEIVVIARSVSLVALVFVVVGSTTNQSVVLLLLS